MNRPQIVGNRFTGLSSVQGCICVETHAHVGAYRIYTRVELPASCGRSSGNMSAVAFKHIFKQFVSVIVIVAVVMYLRAIDQRIQNLVPFPVVLHCLQQLTAGKPFLLEYQLLYNSQSICTCGESAGLGSYTVILGSAFGQIHTCIHAVFKECGNIRQGF